jgi:hypothetical protein
VGVHESGWFVDESAPGESAGVEKETGGLQERIRRVGISGGKGETGDGASKTYDSAERYVQLPGDSKIEKWNETRRSGLHGEVKQI